MTGKASSSKKVYVIFVYRRVIMPVDSRKPMDVLFLGAGNVITPSFILW
jgi:hypothetical protein